MADGNSRNGKKTTGSHATVLRVATGLVDAANKSPLIKKVSLNIITNGGSGGQKKAKFSPINGGIKAVIRGNGMRQEIYFYSSDGHTSQEVEKFLKERFAEAA